MRVLDEIMLEQPDEVRLAFLEVLNWIVHADGIVDDREARYLGDMARMLGLEEMRGALPHEPTDWMGAWTDILAPVGSYVLMQGALVAWADGELHDDERHMLDRLREGLQVEHATYERILSWAHDGHRWVMEGLTLLARQA